MKRDFSIDLIRILSIFLIVQFHFWGALGFTDGFLYTTASGGWGSIGTGLFFMISGFVLVGNYNDQLDVKKFYKKRMLAIYPAYWMMFIIFYCFVSIREHDLTWGGKALWRLIYSVFAIDNYVENFGIDSFYIVGEWFTTIILALYLLYPLLRKCLKSVRCQIVTTLVLTVACYVNMALDLWGFHPDATIFLGVYLFWLGMMVKIYIERLVDNKWIVLVCVLGSIPLLFVTLPYYKSRMPWKNLLVFMMFVWLYALGQILGKYLHDSVKRVVTYLAGVSYCVYLCHHVIINYMISDLPGLAASKTGAILLYALVWIFTLLVSMLVHWCVGYVLQAMNRLVSRKKC